MSELTNLILGVYNCNKIKDAKSYLKKLKATLVTLDKKEQKKCLENLQRLSSNNLINSMLKPKELYNIYTREEALQKILLDDFFDINVKNFEEKIDLLLELFEPFLETHTTKKITKKDIKLIFDTILMKIPTFNTILENINLDILILNNSHKEINSFSIPSSEFKNFKIVCFYMRDYEEYQNGLVTPIYVFLHELGHIFCWLLTRNYRELPTSFYKTVEKYTNGLDPENPDALEVFADSFAMAIMYNTELNIYNPFAEIFPEELFIVLEKYFIDSTEKLNKSLVRKI